MTPGYDDAAIMEVALAAETVIDGRSVVNFGGCAYLGLTAHPVVLEAATQALARYGLGNNLPRRYGVSAKPFKDLEAEATAFFGTEAAHVVGAGYLVSPMAIAALCTPATRLYVDSVCHHSLQYAAKASGLPMERFPHAGRGGDPDALRATIEATLQPGETPLAMMDGITGTFGDIAPVDLYLDAVEAYGGTLYVDDAHAVGVLGPHGEGTASHFGLSANRVPSGASLSKAFSGNGGVLYGSQAFIDAARKTPLCVGSSAGSIPGVAGMTAAMTMLRRDPTPLESLRRNVHTLKHGLQRLGLGIDHNSPTPIASFPVGTAAHMQDIQRRLFIEDGIFLCYSTYTGSGAEGVLRVAVFADHTQAHMDALLDGLARRL